jgi:hypothetical protein
MAAGVVRANARTPIASAAAGQSRTASARARSPPQRRPDRQTAAAWHAVSGSAASPITRYTRSPPVFTDCSLRGRIERLPNSLRYRVTATGFCAALFFTRAYNRILRPGLATGLSNLNAVATPLQRAFDEVETQIAEWINHAQLA